MISNTPTLETQRLILRKFTEDDLEALFAIYHEPEANTFLPWFPVNTLEEAHAFWQERYATAYRQEQAYQYAVCKKSDRLPIGYVNVGMEESHDLGYGLRQAFWRQGIMTEACRAVVDQVKRDGLPYLTATHDRENPRSGAVMRRLGMTYRYSYEELWQPKNKLVTFRMYQLDFSCAETYQGYWEKSAVHFMEDGLSARS